MWGRFNMYLQQQFWWVNELEHPQSPVELFFSHGIWFEQMQSKSRILYIMLQIPWKTWKKSLEWLSNHESCGCLGVLANRNHTSSVTSLCLYITYKYAPKICIANNATIFQWPHHVCQSILLPNVQHFCMPSIWDRGWQPSDEHGFSCHHLPSSTIICHL